MELKRTIVLSIGTVIVFTVSVILIGVSLEDPLDNDQSAYGVVNPSYLINLSQKSALPSSVHSHEVVNSDPSNLLETRLALKENIFAKFE